MAGESRFRKRLRFPGKPEAAEDGPGSADGSRSSAEPSVHLPSPDARDDGRGHSASLEPAGGDAGHRRPLAAAGARGVDLVKRGALRSAAGARTALAYVAERIIENAPRVPVRDLATLRRQFPGLGPEQLADKLVAGAASASATVGAGVGAAAMLPVPPAMPAELAAEITGVAAIEMKLIAELHEVYGQRPPGDLRERAMAYLAAWTEERGIDLTKPTTVNAALGGRMKRELRQQIVKRTMRNLPNLLPFMIGATVGAVLNRRDTKKVAEKVRNDLRTRQVPWDALPDLPPLEQPENPKQLGF
ncbi:MULTISPECIES: hypothetical protein [Streptomyces]|uniref:EcsC protein family protein n=2 Tax=Streptomyces TaxID=1883 RepID=A0A1D8G7M8_9ACTN|nr:MULTISPECIES: hypothetical protein [Streptomyces]AOT61469.1 hypothetical protein A4G23_04357 [Streptomyces rubrolavendulae]KAF0649334.1 hypothetical protein K701_13355 [Streptomyces fradiae ATCC 10745 = DSM 40063]OSY49061.1 hypothetical protein BG846_05404 [Streptomyces fradiae ATCC 10745 = DSM 40063]QEV14456.1 hypothetical protein CP974_23455 [Streptomyces fradiae ATCC 10745 = DSM 40063]UQS30316.1 hypothetical protein J5J01_00515 [Streptomyces fradiae]